MVGTKFCRQGAAAKIRYHMFYRVGVAMVKIAEVESSEEYQVLLRAAEALESASGGLRKAA